jgi:glycosyltransferase involved in cell wall biosynthesis
MTIAHITTGLEDGGAEACLYRLCSADHSNVHVVVSLTGLGKYGKLLANEGVPVLALRMPCGRPSLSGIIKLFKEIKVLQPNVVQTWMYHANLLGGLVARLAGVKCIAWGVHHGELAKDSTRRATRLVARVSGLLSGRVPMMVVFCAHSAAASHQRMGYSLGKTRVVCNGYDITSFAPDSHARHEVRRHLCIAEDVPLLGMVARFDPAKDHQNLLSSLTLLRARGVLFECLLVGEGVDSANTRLNKLIKQYNLGGCVHLLGSKQDIRGIMNAIDVHVLSSSVEAFPNVVAEAMACGTPCVATNVGDSARIIGNTGWLVPPRDPLSLAAALADALDKRGNPAWSSQQHAARQQIVDRFSIASMVTAYNLVWAEITARNC